MRRAHNQSCAAVCGPCWRAGRRPTAKRDQRSTRRAKLKRAEEGKTEQTPDTRHSFTVTLGEVARSGRRHVGGVPRVCWLRRVLPGGGGLLVLAARPLLAVLLGLLLRLHVLSLPLPLLLLLLLVVGVVAVVRVLLEGGGAPWLVQHGGDVLVAEAVGGAQHQGVHLRQMTHADTDRQGATPAMTGGAQTTVDRQGLARTQPSGEAQAGPAHMDCAGRGCADSKSKVRGGGRRGGAGARGGRRAGSRCG